MSSEIIFWNHRSGEILYTKMTRITLFIGSIMIIYAVANPATMLTRWEINYHFLSLGGSLSAIGLIFMLIDSREQNGIVSFQN